MAESPTSKTEERLFFPSSIPEDSRNLPSTSGIAPQTLRLKRRSKDDKTKADETDAPKWDESSTPSNSSCPLESQHVGSELLNLVVPLPIDTLFNLVFLQDQFMREVYTAKKATDFTCSPWQQREDGARVRQITCTVPVPPSSFSPKVAYSTENQVLLPHTSPGEVYIVESEVLNSGVPYGDAFYVSKHFCLCRQGNAKTSVVCWGAVKFKKTLWGFVKTTIEKNTYIGLEGMIQELGVRLTAEAEKINNPGLVRKRRKTGVASSPRPRSNSPSNTRGSQKTRKQEDTERNAKPLTVAVLAISLVSLLIGNVVLYRRLSLLEEMAALVNPTSPSLSSTRYLSLEKSWEDVARILHKQQRQHDSQLEVWKTKVVKASHSLKDVQDTLSWMIDKIRVQEEVLQSAVEEESEELKQLWLRENTWKEEQLNTIAEKYSSEQLHQEA